MYAAVLDFLRANRAAQREVRVADVPGVVRLQHAVAGSSDHSSSAARGSTRAAATAGMRLAANDTPGITTIDASTATRSNGDTPHSRCRRPSPAAPGGGRPAAD